MSTTITSNSIQTRLLEQVRMRLPEQINLADELAELLSVSRDSAYRRIRGETVLSLDEAKKLYDKFGVSIDEMFSPESNMVHFNRHTLADNYSLDRWLDTVHGNLQTLINLPEKNKEMIYAAKDIPIFHYFRLPELCAFKMYFFLRSIVNDPKYNEKLYEPSAVPRELTAIGARIWDLYASIPTIEIWTDEAINSPLKQIRFFHECGFFADTKYATHLCDQLVQLMNMVKEEAAEGKTTDGNSFQLYENEIIIADNTVLAKMDNKRAVFINYNSLNLLSTTQESFGAKTEAYLNNLITNSIQISSTGGKERNKFFSKMIDRIEALRKELI